MKSLRIALACALVSACVQPSVRSIVGPDGRATLFVSCRETGDCYELAGSHCPHGYNIQRAQGAALESYLVSCRTPVARAPEPYYYARANPSPAPAARTTAPSSWVARPNEPAAPENGWPPSSQSVDPPHPWAQHAPPPPPPPPPGPDHQVFPEAQNGISFPRPISSEELDVGY